MSELDQMLENLMPRPQIIDGAYVWTNSDQTVPSVFTICGHRPNTLMMSPDGFRRLRREIKRVIGVKGRFGKRTVLFRYDADRLRVKPL